jgi:hypothetical protein
MRAAAGILLTGIVAVVSSSSACTLVHEASATQCRSEEDCRSLGPEFAETTCSVDRVCVPLPPEADLCSTNAECTTRNGGIPHRCLPSTHQCVPILTPECPRKLDGDNDFLNDNAIFLATSFPNDIGGIMWEAAIETARDEIRNAYVGGLPPAVPGGEPRPLVIVSCPSEPTGISAGGSIPGVIASAKHVANVLQAPAVIGPFTSTSVLATVPNIYVPAKVASFINTIVPSAVTGASEEFVFRMAARPEVSAGILPPMMKEFLEPRIRNEGIAEVDEDVRVMIIAASDASNLPAVDFLRANLRWNFDAASPNGHASTDARNANNFKFADIGDAADIVRNPNVANRASAAVSEAIAFRPHLVIIATEPDYAFSVMVPLDLQWPGSVPKPLIVSTLPAWLSTGPAAIDVNGPNENLRRRYYGLTQSALQVDERRRADYKVRLLGKFPDLIGQTAVETPFFYGAYDSVWLTAYAIMAAGAAEINGEVISRNVRGLAAGGQVIRTGAEDSQLAARLLLGGEPVQVHAIAGPLKFNEQQETSWNAGVFCVRRDGATGVAVPQDASYQFDPVTGTTLGALNCPFD